MTKKAAAAFSCLILLVFAAYSNHFHNDFHFDDSHTIVQNPYIRDVHNLPRFFTDASLSSVLPANRMWRPLVSASLAIDYRLGGGLNPFWFHVSTFIWFVVLLGLLYVLYLRVFDQARRRAGNLWLAFFGAALFGVHPAVAETVNYIIQRADLYSTLGVVASLVVWIEWPILRKFGLYLLPLAAAILSKPPAMVFPAVLFLYLWLVEGDKPRSALKRSLPSLVIAALLAWLTTAMTPASFTSGGFSPYAYRITQPAVIFRYFRTFFVPTGLTADTDRAPFDSIFDPEAVAGFLFLVALIAVAVWTTRARETRPIAFGLFWFLLAILPTSLFPLAEVENDHRMFFPFAGLGLSVCWASALWLDAHPVKREFVAAAAALVLALFAVGTWERNRVWRSEESLWYDVTLKSPHNGRGLMNYGLTQMSKGQTARALSYFQKALGYNPNYYVLEVNLGVANGALHNDAEAERRFARAIELAPGEAVPQYYYSVWLRSQGRLNEAASHLNTAVADNPSYLDASHLLMQVYAQESEAQLLRQAAQATLNRFPADPEALGWLKQSDSIRPTADAFLNQSLTFYQQRKFDESIEAARKALELRPDYSEAWNNIAAAYNSEARWDDGINAAEHAVHLRPDNQLARNNLAWALQQKHKAN